MRAKTVSKSKRYNEIFHILLGHGLPSVVKDLAAMARTPEARPPTAAVLEEEPVDGARAPVAARVRAILEDLGPTFIKIGQLLGTRPDLIPKEFIEEFKKMYDQTTPTPFDDVRAVVESELGKPLDAVFASFETVPLASASIAQVHRAVLRTGDTVAVKVQHPGIEERMRTDFQILKGIVQFTERVFSTTRVWQPVRHLEEIRLMLNKELDFRNELRTQILVEENFRDLPEVKVPHPHLALSSPRVLVMEFIEGAKFRERHRLRLTADDNTNLARIITHAMAKQIFVDRLFHADPSPGNLLLMGPNQVCFLDFGAVGQVTRRRARLIFEFLQSLSSGNLEETARCIVDLCDVRREYDTKRFLYDLERIIEYYETEHASPADPVLLEKIINLANTHGMLLPADFMLITRSLYQFDGICKELDPNYELVRVLTPFIQRTVRDRLLSAPMQTEGLTLAAQDFAKLVTRLPTHIENLMVKLERGQLSSRIEITGLEEYKRHRAALSYFVSFSLLVGLLAFSSTVAYAIGGAPAFRVAAFVSLTALLGWALVMVITRQAVSRRR